MYTCPECGRDCTVHVEDQGIGSYEFQGVRGFDSHKVLVSDCCEVDVEESALEYEYEMKIAAAEARYDAMKEGFGDY